MAHAGAVGWYKYYTFRKATAYALGRATFIEDYRKTSQAYAPVTFLRSEGDQMYYQQAKQVIRNGQIFVDEDRLSYLGLKLRDLAHFLESQPFLFAVFTHDDVRIAANAAK